MKKEIIFIAYCFIITCIELKAQGWKEIGTGSNALKANNPIYSITTDNEGNIYAVGSFTDANNAYFVAKWNGTSWSELGTGTNALKADSVSTTIVTDDSGYVYVAGNLADINKKYYVAKWNGTSWAELGNGSNALNANNPIYTLAKDTSGHIYAAGAFTNGATSKSGYHYVAVWNGTTWSELGAGTHPLNANDNIWTVKADNSGNIYTAGAFTDSKGYMYVAKWNGTTWSELGGNGSTALGANNTINSIAIDNSGNIYASGDFTDLNGNSCVTKWNGSKWSVLGALGQVSYILSITVDNSGNVYAVGTISDPYSNDCVVAKWDGKNWVELGTGSNSLNANNIIRSIVIDNSGYIYIAGNFTDSHNYTYVAQWSTPTITATLNPLAETEIVFYPNPGKDILYFNNVSENIELTVLNILGEEVMNKELNSGNFSIDMNSLRSGTYTILLTGKNNAYPSVKWIKL